MAYRPSYRRSRTTIDNLQPDMTPIMNLMVVLIPLLLSSAQLIKIGIIELDLPPAKGAATLEGQPREELLRLDLSVTVTDNGFYLSSYAGLEKSEEGGPSVPKKSGRYDYDLLSKRLYEIKKKAAEKFPDTNSVIIQAEPHIDYQVLVSTMDATRSLMLNGQRIDLFPKVSLSARVL